MTEAERLLNTAFDKNIAERYPHLRLPTVVYAAVTQVRQLDDTYELSELELCSKETGTAGTVTLTAHWYEYTLSVLNSFGSVDEGYPPLPGIHSRLQLTTGVVVAVALAYGELAPAIIGEVVL